MCDQKIELATSLADQDRLEEGINILLSLEQHTRSFGRYRDGNSHVRWWERIHMGYTRHQPHWPLLGDSNLFNHTIFHITLHNDDMMTKGWRRHPQLLKTVSCHCSGPTNHWIITRNIINIMNHYIVIFLGNPSNNIIICVITRGMLLVPSIIFILAKKNMITITTIKTIISPTRILPAVLQRAGLGRADWADQAPR